jgi:hypothetical protein
MRIANLMKTNDKLSGLIAKSALSPLLAFICVVTLLISGCQSSSSSSSSSSTATSSPSTPAPSPSPQTSSPSPSQSSSSSSSASQGQPQQQKSSSSQEPGGSETAYEEEGSESSGGESGAGEDFPSQGESGGLPGDVLSQEEAVAVLDGQFDESIAVFDGMIIGERAAAQAAQDEFPGDDSVFDDDSPLFEEADISEDSDSQGSPTDGQEGDGGLYSGGGGDGTAGETASSRNGSRSGGINTNMPGGPVPSDIPDGSDDDIVARQIREAAMKEQDPVLREKLWDEYRKYKKGQ